MAQEFVVDIEIEGLEELKRKMRSEVAATSTRKFLQRSGNAIIAKAKPLAPVNTGTLRRSIDKEVATTVPVPTYVKVGTNVEYAPFVEFGRDPGHRPPYEAISWWYRRKNSLGPDADVFAAVTAIQDKIERFGIKEKPFLRKGFEGAVTDIQRYVVVWGRELEEAFKNER